MKRNNKKRNWGLALVIFGILMGSVAVDRYRNPDAEVNRKIGQIKDENWLVQNGFFGSRYDDLITSERQGAVVGMVICSLLTLTGTALLVVHHKRR